MFFPITIRAGAVAAYERVMLPRGFDTVDNSLRLAGQLFGNAD